MGNGRGMSRSSHLMCRISSQSTQRRPCQNRLVNEPGPSRSNFKRRFFRCQCRVVTGWFCETVVSRKHENAVITGSYGFTPYGPQFRASENTGPERTPGGHSLARLVERAARITPENNGKIRPKPDRENAFVGASGGERGIRTLETVPRLHTFQACAFDHSATSPSAGCLAVGGGCGKGAQVAFRGSRVWPKTGLATASGHPARLRNCRMELSRCAVPGMLRTGFQRIARLSGPWSFRFRAPLRRK